MSALELRGVSVTRGRGRHAVAALRGVNVCIEPGEMVLVEGPSGAGKTTLLCVAAGLLTADTGEVLIAGRSLATASPAERRAIRARHVGFVFQRANLLDGLTVRENVLLAAALAHVAPDEARRRADRLLDALGIEGLAERSTVTLSGGEEHRVAVARALVHRPDVVLADEPTGNLDGASGRAVAEALATLAREAGVAVVVATHDARLRPFADRRLYITDGRVDSAPPEEGTTDACANASSTA